MFSTQHADQNKLHDMADDYDRLLCAAKELRKLKTPSDVAKYIGEYDQMMTNWKSRGIPKGKVIDIANKIGCDPVWLRDGLGVMVYSASEQHNTAEQLQASYQVRDTLDDDLAELNKFEADAYSARLDSLKAQIRSIEADIRSAANKARQEKSDRQPIAGSGGPPSEDRRTA